MFYVLRWHADCGAWLPMDCVTVKSALQVRCVWQTEADAHAALKDSDYRYKVVKAEPWDLVNSVRMDKHGMVAK